MMCFLEFVEEAESHKKLKNRLQMNEYEYVQTCHIRALVLIVSRRLLRASAVLHVQSSDCHTTSSTVLICTNVVTLNPLVSVSRPG